MNHPTLQLTIRGIDPKTKNALVKKASQQGLSLNQYAIKALQNSIGTMTTMTMNIATKP